MKGRVSTVLTLTATVMEESTPLPGLVVYFYYSLDGVSYVLIDSDTTDSNGVASVTDFIATGKTWFRTVCEGTERDYVWKWRSTVFEDFKKGWHTTTNQPNFNVTRKILLLGIDDTTTGWYSQNYADVTIEMIIVTDKALTMQLPPGVYVRLDGVGVTDEDVEVGDKIEGPYATYEVKTVRPHEVGEVFNYNECDLAVLPFEE